MDHDEGKVNHGGYWNFTKCYSQSLYNIFLYHKPILMHP